METSQNSYELHYDIVRASIGYDLILNDGSFSCDPSFSLEDLRCPITGYVSIYIQWGSDVANDFVCRFKNDIVGSWDWKFDNVKECSLFLLRLQHVLRWLTPSQIYANRYSLSMLIGDTRLSLCLYFDNYKTVQPPSPSKLKSYPTVTSNRSKPVITYGKPSSTRVYLFDMSNDTIKFGISDDVVGRRAAIRTASGLEVVRWCYTPNFASNIAKQIESTLLTATEQFKTLGEYRRMDYDDAKKLLLSQSSIEREELLKGRD